MSELESSALKEFKKTIRSIRSSSDYPRSITVVKNKMGLPDSTKEVEIEALLIHATREKFGESLDADMVLMALGLLKGFDNHRNRSENRSGKTLITERRKMFLKMSNYVADRHNHDNERRMRYYKSYEELEAAGKDDIRAVVSALGSDDGDDIDKVAQHLYSKKSIIDGYLSEAKKYLIYDKKGNIVDVMLQELKNTRQVPVTDTPDEFFSLNQEQKEDVINEQTSTATEEISEEEVEVVPTDPPSPIKNRLFRVLATICTISISMLGVVVTIFVVNYLVKNYGISTAKEESRHITAREIEIENKNIMLSLGKSTDLTVHIRPSELEPSDLFYVSTHPNVVYVDNIHSNHITAEKSLDSDAQRSVIIVVHDIDGIAQDTATVTVKGTNQNKSELDGKNNGDTAPDDFQENID